MLDSVGFEKRIVRIALRPSSVERGWVGIVERGTAPEAVDKVFLTGGTSFVPAVRRIFSERFASDRIETGGELISIAHGLALIGERDDIEQWTVPVSG